MTSMLVEMWLSSRSGSNLLSMCDRRKKQLVPAERTGQNRRRAERDNRPQPWCHRRRLYDPEGWVYTHGPASSPTLPCLHPFCPFWRQRAAEITPPEPVTLFNVTSGQSVTILWKTQGKRGGRKSFKPRAKFVCVRSHLCVSLCARAPVRALWVVSCGLQSGKVAYWRRWVNNMQFSLSAMLSLTSDGTRKQGPDTA